MEQKLQALKLEIKILLEEHPEGIKVNSFWGLYERKYHGLPEPKVFNVRKRSEILDRCSDVYRRVGSGAAVVIHAKSEDDSEQMQPRTCKTQSATAAVTARQSTSAQAGLDQCSGGGSFYQRFYAESDTDSDSMAKPTAGPPQARHVTNPAARGSYSGLLGARPGFGTIQSNAFASHTMSYGERFAVPSVRCSWSAPPARSSARYQTPPGSRDSSASRSSDSARNVSPAPGVRQSGPRHQPPAVPTPVLPAGRPSAQVSMTGVTGERGRRMHYSREQLNSAAEDCIDRLSVAKDYVSLERISLLFCQDFEVSSVDELGLRQIDDLACVNEHKRLECKVNAYIQNFVKVHSRMLYYILQIMWCE